MKIFSDYFNVSYKIPEAAMDLLSRSLSDILFARNRCDSITDATLQHFKISGKYDKAS